MLCKKCGNKLFIEDKLDYPLICYYCDENMFIFEGIDEYDGETQDMYNYLEWVPKIVDKVFRPDWYNNNCINDSEKIKLIKKCFQEYYDDVNKNDFPLDNITRYDVLDSIEDIVFSW